MSLFHSYYGKNTANSLESQEISLCQNMIIQSKLNKFQAKGQRIKGKKPLKQKKSTKNKELMNYLKCTYRTKTIRLAIKLPARVKRQISCLKQRDEYNLTQPSFYFRICGCNFVCDHKYYDLKSYIIFKIFMKILLTAAAAFIIVLVSLMLISQTPQSPVKNSSITFEPEMVGDTDLSCGFTQDFENFLKKQGLEDTQIMRKDIPCVAYGGKASNISKVNKVPIIFIHGNSDVGYGRGLQDGKQEWQTGFRVLAAYFASQGYAKEEMYTFTWGYGDANQAQNTFHSKKYTTQVRSFIEAVQKYSGHKRVNIIGHSMGVTLARKAIKGGDARDHSAGDYNVGPSIKDKVKNFVGLAGANFGLVACIGASIVPTCGQVDGFFPGYTSISNPSVYLNDINKSGGSEAQNVYVIWSKYDDLIGFQCLVWGKVTCRIPGQNAEIIRDSPNYTHIAVRDTAGPDVLKWFQN